MRFIFLDIDGVLNSDKYIGSGKFNLENPISQIDPDSVLLINKLVDKTGAVVILSSNWRLLFSLTKINKMFTKCGSTFRVTAKTPSQRKISSYREDEVNEFLSKNPAESFVILDDVNEFYDLKNNLVLINSLVGITEKDLDKAIRILL